MRVFIDACDLIDIFNHSSPVSAAELSALFVAKQHELVVPFSLVSELVPADNDDLVIARRFTALEDIPHVFFQQQRLPAAEIAQAADDIANGRDPRPHLPYVAAFQDLWGEGFDPVFLMDLNRTVRMRGITFQVRLLARQAPHIFHWTADESAEAVKAFIGARANRQPLNTKRGFRDAVVRWLREVGLEAADGKSLDAFSAILRNNPRIAPAWRLYVEVVDQLMGDAA